ncbi:hypothetical protein LCGC14_2694750 [marine sediment metagenome]|uniref:Uncharacterized protein n=1 Tax=marine sediment metagenome TaxID=412755 RepID=A0A0F9C976_9ZZZZ
MDKKIYKGEFESDYLKIKVKINSKEAFGKIEEIFDEVTARYRNEENEM